LLTAFDSWSSQTQDAARQEWLQDIVREADPNFKLRSSPEYQALWKDEEQVADLAKNKIPAPLLINEGIRQLNDGADPLPGLRGIVHSDKDNYWGQLWLGMAYLRAKDLKQAKEHFLEATRLRRESGVAFNNLGCAYFYQAQFDEAQLNFHRAAQLLPTNHPLFQVVQEHLQKCKRYLVLDGKLNHYLDDKAKNKKTNLSDEEQLELADLCYRCKQMFWTSYQLTAGALDRKPQLASDPRFAHHLYQGARAAVLAADGAGVDAKELKSDAREELRKRALKWLQADLKAWADKGQAAPVRAGQLSGVAQWLKEPDLASVREKSLLASASISMMEREAWEQFWTEVQSLVEVSKKVMKQKMK
jgi:tetratricopeptide (TPR) repeat protein